MVKNPSCFWIDTLLRFLLEIFIPPFPPELLILHPLGLLLLPVFPPFVHRREPLFSRCVLFGLRRVSVHTCVHRFLLLAAENCCSESVIHGAGGEVYAQVSVCCVLRRVYQVALISYLALHRHICCGRACGRALVLGTLDLTRGGAGCVMGRRREKWEAEPWEEVVLLLLPFHVVDLQK